MGSASRNQNGRGKKGNQRHNRRHNHRHDGESDVEGVKRGLRSQKPEQAETIPSTSREDKKRHRHRSSRKFSDSIESRDYKRGANRRKRQERSSNDEEEDSFETVVLGTVPKFPEEEPIPLTPYNVAKALYLGSIATVGWAFTTFYETPKKMYSQAAPQQRNLAAASFKAPKAGKRYS